MIVSALAAVLAATGSLDPELLALCSSPDVNARRYCLHAIAREGDPRGEARAAVRRLTVDPELGAEAVEIETKLYGAAPAPGAEHGEPPPPLGPAQSPEPSRRRAVPGAPTGFHGDPSRVIYAPTAFTQPAGSATFNAFELGTFRVDFGASDSVSLGVQSALPIGFIAIGPTAHVGIPFEGGAVGFYGSALFAAAFAGSGGSLFLLGGGPMVTLGDYDRYFNLGVLAYYAKPSDSGGGALVAPHLGGAIRVSPRVRFGIEGYLPALYSSDAENQGFGHFAAVAYGLRIFGDSVFGDFALVAPICDGCGDLYKVLPLGIPFLNIGTTW